MDTNKAAYWIALGVLALGLNSEYQHGRFPALQQVADQAGATICRLSTRAEQSLAVLTTLTTRKQSAMDNLHASVDRAQMARDQAEQLQEQVRDQVRDQEQQIRDRVRDHVREQIRAQAEMVRAQAEMQRAQIERIRFSTSDQFRLVRAADHQSRRIAVICPKTGARIVVNAGPDTVDLSTDVEIKDSF